MRRSPSAPRIPSHDLGRVLQVATELQRRSDGEREDSISLVELEAAAAEAGIAPRFVRTAARRLGQESVTAGGGLLGPPSVWVAEGWFPGAIDAGGAHHLIAELQATVPVAGGTVEAPAEGLWRLADGSRALVQVSQRGGEVRVSVVSDRKRLQWGLLAGGAGGGALVGLQGAASTAFALGMATVEFLPILVLASGVVGGAAGALLGLGSWRLVARRWRGRVERALDRVRGALPVPGGGEEEAGRDGTTPSSEAPRPSRGSG